GAGLGLTRAAVAAVLPLLLLGAVTNGILAGLSRTDAYLPLGPLYDLGVAPWVWNVVLLAAAYFLLIFLGRVVIRLLTPDASSFSRAVNRLMTGVLALCAVLVVVPLFYILYYLVDKGIGAINWEFFTNLPAPMGETGGGMANALYGTAMLVLLASVF